MTRHVVFDVYGTLLDTAAPVARLAGRIGPKAAHAADLWRAKQLEYSWISNFIGHYEPFWRLTERALDYTLAALDLGADAGLKPALLDAYTAPDPYPEVLGVLEKLRGGAHALAVFSNGNPEMLETVLSNTGLSGYFDSVVSVDPVKCFKPERRVYAHCAAALNAAEGDTGDITFLSSNGWDAAGAAACGWRTIWVNRKGHEYEFGQRAPENMPENIIETLTPLPGLLSA